MKKGISNKIQPLLKIISMISLIILLFVSIILVSYIVMNQYAKLKHINPLYGLYTIVSPSMEPNINVYDVVLVKRVDKYESLQVGDIITFYSDNIDTGGYTITHRIKNIGKDSTKKNTYITKGDNNNKEDPGYIRDNNIVGRVIYIIPKMGKLQFFISSKVGWFFIILIPALLIIFFDVFKIKKVVNIKKEIESLPHIQEVNTIREKEKNKKLREIIERDLNKKNEKK